MFGKLLISLSILYAQAGVAQTADALRKADALNHPTPGILLERARLKLASQDKAGAIRALQALDDSGFKLLAAITGDSALMTLAGNAEFDALLADIRKRAYPCESDARFSAFDFWVGDWDVRLADGTYAGRNSITKEQHGCLLVEHWTSANGGTGTSINYLDPSKSQWVQVWNDASGSQIQISGALSDKGMQLRGTIYDISSNSSAGFRGQWTPLADGRVRQFFEQYDEDSKQWQPWFEGFYTRATGAAEVPQF